MKKVILYLWLGSAAIVALVRVLHATDLGFDLTSQIEAAENLLHGKGLATYSHEGIADLATPGKLVTLTYFPAGFSLYAAALLALGSNLAIMLKLYGVATTLLGWWGWGRLAYAFMGEGMKRSRFWRWLAYAIAFSCPLLFTPPWHGTDIFLWAALPWVIEWVTRASDTPGGARFDFLAGAACGLCVLMRYAAVYLALYTAFLILLQSGFHLRTLARRAGAFAAGLLPLLAIQVYLNFFVAVLPATPGGLFKEEHSIGLSPFLLALEYLPAANFPLVWWMPRAVVNFLTRPAAEAPWLSPLALAGFVLLPALLARKLGVRDFTAAARDRRIAALGSIFAIPLFLCVCAAVSDRVYVGVERYYLPALPLALFAAYALTMKGSEWKNKIQGALRIASLGYLAAYVFIAGSGIALLLLPGERGVGKRAQLLGTPAPHHWSPLKLTYDFLPSRKYILALLKNDPTTVMVTNRPNQFYADPTVDWSRLHRLYRFGPRYVSGPAKILIVAEDPFETPLGVLYRYTSEGTLRRMDAFENFPGLHLLKRFPEENVKVVEARVPAGTRISLKGR